MHHSGRCGKRQEFGIVRFVSDFRKFIEQQERLGRVERVREELDVGKTVRSAVDVGFARAFGTILDANLTTLIAALFLFNFGTGPVKGFAVTLSIGVLASMFTAVFVSRTIFMMVLGGEESVQMRMRAMDYLAAGKVTPGGLDDFLDNLQRDADSALLMRAADFDR